MPASLPPVPPVQATVVSPAGLRRFHAFQHVGRIAAGTDRDGDVAFLAMRAHLTGEDFVISVIVGDAGDRGHVGGQRDGRQRSPLAFIASDEFRRDVRGVRRAASVAEQQTL